MPISSDSIHFYYTSDAGTADPETSLGGTCNTAGDTVESGQAQAVFDDVPGDEATNGTTAFRALGIYHEDDTYNWLNTSIRVSGEENVGATADTICLGAERPIYGGATSNSIQTIATEYDAPTSGSFVAADWSTVSSNTTPWLQMGGTFGANTIGPDDWCGIWLKRIVPAGASATNNRSFTIEVRGESSASPLEEQLLVFAINWSDNLFKTRRIGSGAINVKGM